MKTREQLLNESRVSQFAYKYLETSEDCDSKTYRINDWDNLTDVNFEKAFQNCVIPLKKSLYNALRNKIKEIIETR